MNLNWIKIRRDMRRFTFVTLFWIIYSLVVFTFFDKQRVEFFQEFLKTSTNPNHVTYEILPFFAIFCGVFILLFMIGSLYELQKTRNYLYKSVIFTLEEMGNGFRWVMALGVGSLCAEMIVTGAYNLYVSKLFFLFCSMMFLSGVSTQIQSDADSYKPPLILPPIPLDLVRPDDIW